MADVATGAVTWPLTVDHRLLEADLATLKRDGYTHSPYIEARWVAPAPLACSEYTDPLVEHFVKAPIFAAITVLLLVVLPFLLIV
jgi:hypothetical protein